MRQRRHRSEGSDNQDRWLITYADLITLLLVFFIVMYAMSEVEKAKFNSLVQSLRGAFQVSTDQNVPSSSEKLSTNTNFDLKIPEIPSKDTQAADNEQKLNELMTKLQNYINENNLTTQVDLVNRSSGVQITIKDNILFDEGSAQLKQQVLPILSTVGGLIKTVQNQVSIEGHTDDQPIVFSSQFKSNWELSTARAHSVRTCFDEEVNIKPARMRVVGYGEYQPRKPNDSEANRAENRRVNIVVLR
jgi:chemotaxis protein MotB